MIHPKAALIERLQKDGRGKPQFVTHREGPDHEPTFHAQVKVQGHVFGDGTGGNKREAERRASEAALVRLDREAADAAEASAAAEAAPSRSGRGRRGKGGETAAAPTEAPEAAAPEEADVFAGPWPVFERVLTESLRIAHERVDADLRGDAALLGIEAFALRLYQDVLNELGEVVDEDA